MHRVEVVLTSAKETKFFFVINVDKTGREHVDYQISGIGNLPNYDEILHELSLPHCTLLCNLSCMKMGAE